MKFKSVTKTYGKQTVLKDFSLDIHGGEILCVLGGSGGGKTTLLNLLAGLISPDGGKIEEVPERLSYIFQEPRLLPNLSVEKNLLFVGATLERAEEMLKATEIYKQKDKRPEYLSGGEKQRVAIARAFSVDFDLLLMDEPFSSLDTGLKIRLIETFAKLWKGYLESGKKRTAVFVTHDIEEALMLADRIAVLKDGKIVFDRKVERSQTQYPSPYGATTPLREEILKVLLNG